ncbi:TPA: glycosyltransferase family 2 protein, partial [Citrobacter werkmanii]
MDKNIMIIYDETVSIIMPAFDAGQYIRKSIQSVLNQTYSHWKLYIIDDCSTDNTPDIVAEFTDSRIVYLRTSTNSGVAEARNVGISKAQGTYIAFLDSDDLWAETKLEKQLCMLKKGNDVVCSFYSTFSDTTEQTLSTRI